MFSSVTFILESALKPPENYNRAFPPAGAAPACYNRQKYDKPLAENVGRAGAAGQSSSPPEHGGGLGFDVAE